MDLARLKIIIYGSVQGVSLRYYTQEKSTQLELKGWVRNNPDGTVEIVAEGEKEKLEELLNWVKSGPKWAKVSKIETEWSEFKDEFKKFEIKY